MAEKIQGKYTGVPNHTHTSAIRNPSGEGKLIHTTVVIGDRVFNAYGNDSAVLISEATIRRLPLELAYEHDDEKGDLILDTLIARGVQE